MSPNPLQSRFILENFNPSDDTLINYCRVVKTGGVGDLRPVNEDDLQIWNLVKNVLYNSD